MLPPPTPLHTLDDLDQRIIDLLREHPRQAIKELAIALNTSEPTITSRIRAMDGDGVMRICAQRDFRAAGFEVLASVDIGIRGRSLDDVAQDVASLEGVANVTIAMGERPLMLLVMARTLEELQHIVLTQLAAIEGVSSVETMIISEVIKYRSEFAALAPRSRT